MGGGLVVAGLTAYGFLVITARTLGPERYAGLSVLWAALFLIGPGTFFPVEQETTRALSARIAQRVGAGPVVRRAAIASSALAVLLCGGLMVLWVPLLGRLFDDNGVLGWALAVGLVGLSGQHLLRGVLAGTGRFRAYGAVLGLEGILRLGACVAAVLWGARSVGVFGLVLTVPAAAAAVALLPGARGTATPGPQAPWKELTPALGSLLAASLLAQFVVNAGPLAVRLLAGPGERAAVSRFLSGLIVARVPLFLFLALQAAVLPVLSSRAASGDLDGFRSGLRKLLALVAAVGGLTIAGASLVGPQVHSMLFGVDFGLGRLDMALLAGGTAAFMLALAAGQALIAMTAYGRLVAGWVAGGLTLVVVTALGPGLLLRVELGYLSGAAVAAAMLVGLLLLHLGRTQEVVAHRVTPPGDLPMEP